MEALVEKVRDHFERSELYLTASGIIAFRAWLVRQMLGSPRDRRVLDVGCGDGSISRQFLAANSVTFLDLSHSMLEEAKRWMPIGSEARGCFVQANFLEAPLGEPFDIVICLGVLAHVTDTRRAIMRLADLVKPGGLCLLQFTDADSAMATFGRWYWRFRELFADPHPYSLAGLTPAEVWKVAAEAGLRPIALRRHACPLPGSRVVGQAVQERYLRWSCRSPLARFTSEYVVVFVKDRKLAGAA
jgi:ubiquinone/menaquinone biosynthesis C-methylase UbiE